MDKQFRLRLLAAGISLALGSTVALAQQPDAGDESQRAQDREQTSDLERQSQQEQSQQSDRQAPLSQSQRDEPRQQSQAGQQDQDDRQAGQQSQQGDSSQIDELSEQDEELSRFVEALRTTGMADSLTDGTEYTIFAPTNDALDAMEGRSLEELQQPGSEELTNLLRAHIVADDVDEEMAGRIQAARTIDGGTVQLSSEGDQLMVGDASIQGEPIQVGSLRVYKIDGVLPQDPSAGLARQEQQEEQDRQIARADEREAEEQEQEQSQDRSVFGDDDDAAEQDESVFGDDSQDDEGAFGGDRETQQPEQDRP